MALTRTDFLALMETEVMAIPAAADMYAIEDPRLVAQMNTMAAFFAALSQQIDVAEVEPFLKARDGTVLAEAALRGILPLARSARVQVSVQNPSAAAITLGVGRGLVDGRGRRYVIESAATIAAGATGAVVAAQVTTRTVSHTVAGALPFYAIEVPPSDEEAFLCALDVADSTGTLQYAPDFCNVAAGDRVYHVETDEYRRLWVRFGADDSVGPVVGWQPPNGTVFTITIRECSGKLALSAGDQFSIETVTSAAEAECILKVASVLGAGANPPSMEFLRMMARYPGTHDPNAVFLADFDFLLRKLDGLEFLAVWNEQAEEAVRGPSVSNINKLFVSFVTSAYTAAAMQARITTAIQRADDSYRIAFVAANEIAVPMTVTATVAAVHDTGDVENQIRTLLLANYGRASLMASRGLSKVFRMSAAHDLMRKSIPALQDSIADFNIVIGATPSPKPEDFRYITASSLVVSVLQATDSMGLFGA